MKICTLTSFVALEMPLGRKRPEKWRTNSWVFLDENALTHRSVLVKDFSAKNNVTTLKHPPIISNLTPANFYLFPRLKLTLKGRRFCDAANIVKNATEELNRLSQNGFQERFQHLYSRWQKCTVAEMGLF